MIGFPLSGIKLRTKLVGLLIFVCVAMLLGSAVSLFGIHKLRETVEQSYAKRMYAVTTMNEVRNLQMQVRMILMAARQESDVFEVSSHNDRLSSVIYKITLALREYAAQAMVPEEKALYDRFITARKEFGEKGVVPTMDFLMAGNTTEADRMHVGTLEPAYAGASSAVDAVVSYQVAEAKKDQLAASRLAREASIIALIVNLVGCTLAMVVGFFITRSIHVGVRATEEGATRLAHGELKARIPLTGEDEMGQIARAVNRVAEEFSGIISTVQSTANQVGSASAQLSAETRKVEVSSRNQASEAGAVAASIEELNRLIQEMDEYSQNMIGEASQVGNLSQDGLEVVRNAARAIEDISRSVNDSARMITALGQRSGEIGNIVGVIRDIAAQTNLLALNAAIEAARAGEQGRGFAVVADEVRKLAEKTSVATTQISEIVQAVQSGTSSAVSTVESGRSHVESGVRLASQAGQSLEQINTSVQRVVQMIEHIANGVRSQAVAGQEITRRAENIARMAADNGSSVSQAASATEEMTRQSQDLLAIVNRFRFA